MYRCKNILFDILLDIIQVLLKKLVDLKHIGLELQIDLKRVFGSGVIDLKVNFIHITTHQHAITKMKFL